MFAVRHKSVLPSLNPGQAMLGKSRGIGGSQDFSARLGRRLGRLTGRCHRFLTVSDSAPMSSRSSSQWLHLRPRISLEATESDAWLERHHQAFGLAIVDRWSPRLCAAFLRPIISALREESSGEVLRGSRSQCYSINSGSKTGGAAAVTVELINGSNSRPRPLPSVSEFLLGFLLYSGHSILCLLLHIERIATIAVLSCPSFALSAFTY